jgi:hypothetical protein
MEVNPLAGGAAHTPIPSVLTNATKAIQQFAQQSGTIVRVVSLDGDEAVLPRPTRKNYQYL